MNCKPGDLAIVMRSDSGNEGKIVRVVRLHDCDHRDLDGVRVEPEGQRWVLEHPISIFFCGAGFDDFLEPTFLFTFPDQFLCPIRDPGDDAKDEMLRPLPKESGVVWL